MPGSQHEASRALGTPALSSWSGIGARSGSSTRMTWPKPLRWNVVRALGKRSRAITASTVSPLSTSAST